MLCIWKLKYMHKGRDLGKKVLKYFSVPQKSGDDKWHDFYCWCDFFADTVNTAEAAWFLFVFLPFSCWKQSCFEVLIKLKKNSRTIFDHTRVLTKYLA